MIAQLLNRVGDLLDRAPEARSRLLEQLFFADDSRAVALAELLFKSNNRAAALVSSLIDRIAAEDHRGY